MKNNLFNKATALVMGSLVIFSGQALAMKSNNNQELTNADVLGESEVLIAQPGNEVIFYEHKPCFSVAGDKIRDLWSKVEGKWEIV